MITWGKLQTEKMIYESGLLDGEIIKDLINSHDTSEMVEGQKYYSNKNKILERKMYYYNSRQERIEDKEKTNKRIPHNFHKILVDQKVSFMVGKPIVIQSKNKEHEKKINLILSDEWDDTLTSLIKNSANKGVEWLHVYIDHKGLFKFVIIPAEEVIPIYDTSLQENLEGIIRYYLISIGGEDRVKVEWWTRESVTLYTEGEDGNFYIDLDGKSLPHYYIGEKGHGWGKVPFIEFRNNDEKTSDLVQYKALIDEYDDNISDFANNLAETQEIIKILKGYESTDLAEFNNNLRYFKTIKVSGENNSGIDKLELNIPVEAKKEMLDRLEENIFLFGQGVNFNTDTFGNSPSGVALKILYESLKNKASLTEKKFRKGIKRLIWFLTEYINLTEKKNYNSMDTTITFRRNMIQDDRETAQTGKESKGIISDETIVAHHPWVEDVAEEIEKLKKQAIPVSLEDIDLGDDE